MKTPAPELDGTLEPLVTKFDRPTALTQQLRRERLHELMPPQPTAVTAVVAPAGFGKTTFLIDWIESIDTETVWLRLDQADADPARFGRNLAETIGRSTTGPVPDPVIAAMSASATVPVARRVASLLNLLAERTKPLHVVLDDYHFAASGDVDEIVTYILDHAPPTLRLCLTSRTQPRLRLARFRAAGRLTEIDAHDLALDRGETAALVRLVAGIEVTDEEARRLHAVTEGWPALVTLVAQAVRARGDTNIANLLDEAGADLDSYVVEEVLASLDGEELDFVRTTSILRQVAGPLADAVRGRPGGGTHLAKLTRAGFPVQRIREDDPWFRYHRQVTRTLRQQLNDREPADRIQELHRRAGAWLEEAGSVELAVAHAIAGHDHERAGRLIDRHWLAEVNRGQLRLVRHWLESLPPSVIEHDPTLALAKAWTNLMAGEIDQVRPYLEKASNVSGDSVPPGASSVASAVALIETLFYRILGQLSASCRSAETALELEAEPDATGRARALVYAGICRFWQGRFDEASTLLNHGAGAADRFGRHMAKLLALGYMGLLEAEQQSYDRLADIAGEARDLIAQANLYLHPTAAPALGAIALSAFAEGIEHASADLDDALAVASIQGEPGLIAYLNMAYAEELDKIGRVDGAERHRLIATGICRQAEDVGFIAARCGTPPSPTPPINPHEQITLTAREAAVLQLLPSSLPLPDVARELYVSHNTVKTHVRSLYRKLGVSSRQDAVREAAARGLV